MLTDMFYIIHIIMYDFFHILIVVLSVVGLFLVVYVTGTFSLGSLWVLQTFSNINWI